MSESKLETAASVLEQHDLRDLAAAVREAERERDEALDLLRALNIKPGDKNCYPSGIKTEWRDRVIAALGEEVRP